MTGISIARNRLFNQLLAGNVAETPRDAVAHFGAVQAQDYLGALWAVGLRTREAVESGVERALAERHIVRCWPMRGTLHFVASEDVRWMLDLLAPRVLARNRARLQRDFDLDPNALRRCTKTFDRALRGGHALTRPELYARLARDGIATSASRGLHILFALAHERLICFGPRRGKQPTFVLLDEWVPSAKSRPREEALAELAKRYVAGHGPASAADLAWWSGLTLKEAKESLSLAGVQIESAPSLARQAPSAQLLPPFDEYTVAYKDRAAVLDPSFAKSVNAGGGILNAIVVVNGLVVGCWKRTLRGKSVEIAVSPFRPLTATETRALERVAAKYARFLGKDDSVTVEVMDLTTRPARP